MGRDVIRKYGVSCPDTVRIEVELDSSDGPRETGHLGPWPTRPLLTRPHLCKVGLTQLEIQIDIKSLFMDGF